MVGAVAAGLCANVASASSTAVSSWGSKPWAHACGGTGTSTSGSTPWFFHRPAPVHDPHGVARLGHGGAVHQLGARLDTHHTAPAAHTHDRPQATFLDHRGDDVAVGARVLVGDGDQRAPPHVSGIGQGLLAAGHDPPSELAGQLLDHQLRPPPLLRTSSSNASRETCPRRRRRPRRAPWTCQWPGSDVPVLGAAPRHRGWRGRRGRRAGVYAALPAHPSPRAATSTARPAPGREQRDPHHVLAEQAGQPGPHPRVSCQGAHRTVCVGHPLHAAPHFHRARPPGAVDRDLAQMLAGGHRGRDACRA